MKTQKEKNSNSGNMERMMTEEFLSGQKQSVQKYWKEMDEIKEKSEKADVDIAWGKLYNRLDREKLIKGRKRNILTEPAFRIAASIILIIGLSLTGIYYLTGGFDKGKNMIITAGADRKNVRVDLPDGSVAFLNRESSLEYPLSFGRTNRTVKLEGEAFFDIGPEADRPFIIDAGKANITVLGTSFNVNTSDNRVEVFVTDGKVALKSNDNEHAVTLEPGDIGSLTDNAASKDINTDPNYLSWKTEILKFDGDSLGKVFSDLQKVHNISIELEDENISERRLTSTSIFNKQSPETIIRIICTTFNLEYDKQGNVFYLYTN
ncbi:MAG: FecR domain-containing protein [Bacteroidales bacterium]|nr:FecR domain-containing protein [Bacteroidales bacterium]